MRAGPIVNAFGTHDAQVLSYIIPLTITELLREVERILRQQEKPFNRRDIGAESNMSRLLHHQLTPIQMNRVRSQAILEQLAGLKDASAVGIRRQARHMNPV